MRIAMTVVCQLCHETSRSGALCSKAKGKPNCTLAEVNLAKTKPTFLGVMSVTNCGQKINGKKCVSLYTDESI